MARKRHLTNRVGMSLLEMVFCMTIICIFGIPLLGCLTTTTRGVGLSRDHLMAQNLSQMLYEYVAFCGNMDDTASFETLAEAFTVDEGELSPFTGCPGQPVSSITTTVDGILIPHDDDPRFDFEGTNKSFVNLFKKFSYTLGVTRSVDDEVITTGTGAALYRIDINVYWKGGRGSTRRYPFRNYLARRKY